MSRAIPLQNASNLRDLGGWASRRGGQIRYGLIYRAPALVNLTQADEAAITALGLRTVCDLRGLRERAQHPVALAGTTTISLPIEPSLSTELRDILHTGQVAPGITPERLRALLCETYRDYALECAAQYRALFATILQPDSLPLLLHCSAGKDRTGFGAALLLSALDVDWADIEADYLATNAEWRREIASNFHFPPALMDVLLTAHTDLLRAAFQAIDLSHGTLDAYLRTAIGLDDAARGRLARLLLQS